MNNMHLADCLKKLKDIDEASGEQIMTRAEDIADERLKQRTRDIMARTSLTSPHFWRGMGLGLSAMFRAVDKQDYRDKQRKAMAEWNGDNSVNGSFEWAFENVRLAASEHVIQKNIPLDTFSSEEQDYLFPSGIPAHDLNFSDPN